MIDKTRTVRPPPPTMFHRPITARAPVSAGQLFYFAARTHIRQQLRAPRRRMSCGFTSCKHEYREPTRHSSNGCCYLHVKFKRCIFDTLFLSKNSSWCEIIAICLAHFTPLPLRISINKWRSDDGILCNRCTNSVVNTFHNHKIIFISLNRCLHSDSSFRLSSLRRDRCPKCIYCVLFSSDDPYPTLPMGIP